MYPSTHWFSIALTLARVRATSDPSLKGRPSLNRDTVAHKVIKQGHRHILDAIKKTWHQIVLLSLSPTLVITYFTGRYLNRWTWTTRMFMAEFFAMLIVNIHHGWASSDLFVVCKFKGSRFNSTSKLHGVDLSDSLLYLLSILVINSSANILFPNKYFIFS